MLARKSRSVRGRATEPDTLPSHTVAVMRRSDISLEEARRIVLAAQGFTFDRPSTDRNAAPSRAILPLVRKLAIVQMDSVNVLVRSHYLPVFSRLGPYERSALDRLAYAKPRRLFEYWGHEASLMPIEHYPLLRWRMQRALDGRGMWKSVQHVSRQQRDFVHGVLQAFQDRGPLGVSEFGAERGTGSWWGWNDTKRAVAFLFWAGQLAVVARRPSFERVYDLAERVIPEPLLQTHVAESEAHRRLIALAASALGVATEPDLRDFYRMDVTDSKRAVAELTDAGKLQEVQVHGWRQPAYVSRGASIPRARAGSALLSPFDSLVWNRARTHRLFDFHYRIEIYTPPHKRVHGYYVLPYLLDGNLVARVDLKSDRASRRLIVHAIYYEPKAPRREVRARLREDLRSIAEWLGLERVRYPARNA